MKNGPKCHMNRPNKFVLWASNYALCLVVNSKFISPLSLKVEAWDASFAILNPIDLITNSVSFGELGTKVQTLTSGSIHLPVVSWSFWL